MTGTCHCGEVQVSVSHKPEYVNFCDCSLCAKSGGVWGYYRANEISVKGPTSSYRRADYDRPAVDIHFCPDCGSTTHWMTNENFESDRAGINMRIFDPADLRGIEARFPDGRNWFGKSEPVHRRRHGKLGVDAFL